MSNQHFFNLGTAEPEYNRLIQPHPGAHTPRRAFLTRQRETGNHGEHYGTFLYEYNEKRKVKIKAQNMPIVRVTKFCQYLSSQWGKTKV